MFKNSAKSKARVGWNGEEDLRCYGYDKPSSLMYLWGTLLQAVVSQAGTYMLFDKFHDGQCGIYKCEGGCRIEGFGELVLMRDHCYWNHNTSDKYLDIFSTLITEIVLRWDPVEPIDSMIVVASECAGCSFDGLQEAIEKSRCGGVFGGNSLSSFFDHNPFDEFKVDEKYERYCMERFNGMSKTEINQEFSDRKKGKKLFEKLKNKCKENSSNGWLIPMTCNPRRMKDGILAFWINTGSSTQIDGWKTEKEINEFLKGDGVLVDTAK